MRFLYRISIFIFLFPSPLFAQTGNRNDYIVTVAGDTIYGKIEYNNIIKNKNECRFTNEEGTGIFTPSQVSGFCIGDEQLFTSRVVENTFLQVLIAGELSLYKDGFHFYLEKKGHEVLKLESRVIIDTLDGKIYTREDLFWKGYVNLLVHECFPDPKIINNLSIDERSLTELAIKYNNCKGIKYIDYLAARPWNRVELGISSGITQSCISVDNTTEHSHFLPGRFMSYDPSFGIVMVLSSPRLMNRIALQSEMEYISSNFFSEVIKTYSTVTAYYDTYIEFTTLSFPQSIRYTVIDRNYRVFVNLGLLFAKNLHEKTRIENEMFTGDQVFTGSLSPYIIDKSQAGLWGGITFRKNFDTFSAGIPFKYSRMNKIFYDNFDSNITRLSLSLIISTK